MPCECKGNYVMTVKGSLSRMVGEEGGLVGADRQLSFTWTMEEPPKACPPPVFRALCLAVEGLEVSAGREDRREEVEDKARLAAAGTIGGRWAGESGGADGGGGQRALKGEVSRHRNDRLGWMSGPSLPALVRGYTGGVVRVKMPVAVRRRAPSSAGSRSARSARVRGGASAHPPAGRGPRRAR